MIASPGWSIVVNYYYAPAEGANFMGVGYMTEAEELAAWRLVGRALWPMVRLWPITGVAGSEQLAIVDQMRTLLNVDESLAADVGGVERDVCSRLADALVEDGWIRRVSPDARNDLMAFVRGFGARGS